MCHNIFSGGKYPGVILRVTEPNEARKLKLDKLLKPESLLPTSIGMKAVCFPVIFLGPLSPYFLIIVTMIIDDIRKAEFSADLGLLIEAVKANLAFLGKDIVVNPDVNSGVSTFTDRKTGEVKVTAFVSVYRRDPEAVADKHIGFLKLLKGPKKSTLTFVPDKE